MREYLLGNVAIARGIIEAGAGSVSGYPGTPSSEIIEALVDLKGDLPVHIEWSVNEKVALEVAAGASWAGARAAATMKHVGLNVAADPFMTLAYLGVGAGLVVISADDPFCHSSQNEQDTRRFAAFAGVPCLDPADPEQAKEMVKFGFDLSERFNIPVVLRPTTRVSHARADVDLGVPGPVRRRCEFVKDPTRRVALPTHARPLHHDLLEKQAAMEEALAKTPWNSLHISGDHGIIASGISGLYAEEAMRDLDLDLSILRIGTYPLPSKMIGDLLERVESVLVVEELEPVVEERVRAIALEINPDVEILGKGSSRDTSKAALPREGELDLLTVRNALAESEGLAALVPPRMDEAMKILPPRPPSLCPGCSHRATYYAMKKAFGKDAIFPSDIGCYTMAVPMGTVDTCLCMGASITLASGIRHGGEERPICCSLGDSTFLHGGLAGLLNAAYNRARITVTVLDNRTTAMTGHQPHPGTGVTATGEETVNISIEEIAKALGAGFVETVDPYDIDAAIEAFRRAKEHPGLSVIVARQACVIKARRDGSKRKSIKVSDACIGCKTCIRFGCPAIEFAGEAAKINALCTGCGVCMKICPANAITEVRI